MPACPSCSAENPEGSRYCNQCGARLGMAPAAPERKSYTPRHLAERILSQRASLRGEVPSPLSPPSGCHFHTRCPHKKPICEQLAPPLAEAAPGHMVACHLYSTATASPVIEETSTERA